MLEKNTTPTSYYQPLFDLLHQKHGITALESEMADIIHVVERMQGKQHGAVWVKASEKISDIHAADLHWRFSHNKKPIASPFHISWPKLIQEYSNTKSAYDLHEVEWLDESGTSATKTEKPTLTQSRADFIREVNERDMEGLEVIEFAEWFWGYCKEYHRGGTYVTNFNEVMTVMELYNLFKQQKYNP